MSDKCMTDGGPVSPDHRELKPNGQQKGYVVLTPEERAKGFVRPVRRVYVHVGRKLRGELEMLEETRQSDFGEEYVAIDRFNVGDIRSGTFLTQSEVDQVHEAGRYGGCGTATTMALSIAETYARDPGFYGGTFCIGCRDHLPLSEFVWDGTDDIVGS